MIRVVTAFRDGLPPKLLILCDEFTCGECASYTVEIDKFSTLDEAVNAFLVGSGQSGWGISIARQICPGHFSTLQVNNKVQQNRIVSPGGIIDLTKRSH